MSVRQLMTRTTGALTVLTVASLVAVAVTWHPRAGEADAAAVIMHQQDLVADMNRRLDVLSAAEDFATVTAARRALGRSVVAFDRNLDALIHGGAYADGNGRTGSLRPVKDEDARRALSGVAALWLQVGVPLADLAGGEYSVFSAAGRQALEGLRENGPGLVVGLADAAESCDGRGAGQGRAALAARLLAGACLLALVGALVRRRRAARPAPVAMAGTDAAETARDPAPLATVAREAAAPLAPRSGSGLPPVSCRSPVDFADVSAAVDRLTVDTSTVAAGTERVRMAVDSVDSALQGLLDGLQGLSDDTAEGYRIVRGASNAAGFVAQVAAELAASVHEMGPVVSRMNELARKSRQTAVTIDQEARQTGRTGAGITDAVSGQVKELAAQTSHATADIEHIVSQMLARTREYEEAVAQILKHVSAIHKVSQNLGQVVLEPPADAVVGPPRPRTRVLEPAAGPAPADLVASAEPTLAPAPAFAAFEDAAEGPEPTPAEVSDQTAAAIEDAAAGEPARPKPNVFLLNDPGQTARPRTDVEA